MSTATPSPESAPEDVRNAVFAVWRRRYGDKPVSDELFGMFCEVAMGERGRIVAIAEDYALDALPDSEYRLACTDLVEAIRSGDTAKEDWEKRMREG